MTRIHGADLKGESALAKLVNLDAMIKREDLDVTDKDPALIPVGGNIKAADLEHTSATFHILKSQIFRGKLLIGLLIKLPT